MHKQVKQRGSLDHSRILRNIREYRLPSSDNRQIIEDFFITLDTPVSLSCYMLYKYHEYEQLVKKDLDPLCYNDPESFRNDYASVSFLRKHASLKTGIDTKKEALQTFWSCEEKCRVTNQDIRLSLLGRKKLDLDEYTLSRIIRKIDLILGDFDIDYVLDNGRWGPGSTLSVTGDNTSAPAKFDIDCDITRDAYYLYGSCLEKAYPLWDSLSKPRFVTGNKIITVPKNAKTDRTIAIEPGINSWIQLGIGSLIRKRLRKAGYNLNSDLKNIRGAYKGSLFNDLATIDFKAASDTISKSVVELLLPPRWLQCLIAARSPFFTLDKVSYRSEKFSTMGNGFTFELESLIFVSIALAICECEGVDDSDVSIFGDDLVIPSSCVTKLTSVCTALGFTINTDKSFSNSAFRESCGSYYFLGADVKPIFLKKDTLYVKDVYRLANAFRSLSHRHVAKCGCDIRFRRIWSRTVHRIPKPFRFFGPVSSGDACIHENFSEEHAQRPRNGWCGYYYTGLPSIACRIESETNGLLLARLRGASVDMEYNNSTPLRARSHIVLKKRMFTAQWYDLGPWI